jgi:hypothetical protein
MVHMAQKSTKRRVDFNLGMDHAEAALLPAPGMSPHYYEGYEFGCAFEFTPPPPRPVSPAPAHWAPAAARTAAGVSWLLITRFKRFALGL